MGLDAVVFCNCVETEKLRVPHPFPLLLHILKDGRPEIRSKDTAKITAHEAWMALPPCKHNDLIADGCSLGNAGGVSTICKFNQIQPVFCCTELRHRARKRI